MQTLDDPKLLLATMEHMNTPGSTAGTASNLRQIRSFVSAEDSTLSAATLEQIGAAVLQRSDGSFVGSAVDAATIAAAATALTRNPSMTREALQDLVQEVRALLPRVHICPSPVILPL